MEINYKLYAIFLFIIILVLIYLLNRTPTDYNELIEEIKEGFEVDDYIELDNVYFDLSNIVNLSEETNIEDILKKVDIDKKCNGITVLKSTANTYNKYYKITNLNSSYSELQGSGEQRLNSTKYKTYIKKSVAGSSKLLITKDNIESNFFNIRGKSNMYMGIKDDHLCGINKSEVQISNLYDNVKLKFVNGLYGTDNISIRLYNNNLPNDMYITHNYPVNRKLTLKKITLTDGDEIKKKASFRVLSGLTQEGISFKILGFENIYFKLAGNNNKIDSIIVEKILNDRDRNANELIQLQKLATFYFSPDIEVINPGTNINDLATNLMANDMTTNNEDDNSVSSVTKEDKIRILKNKNMNSLEKQSFIIDTQNKKIKDMELLHFSNIGKIGREFANQSAKLALAKYLTEKDDIDLLNSKGLVPGSNMPSVQSFKS
jgi:hypothetical protein